MKTTDISPIVYILGLALFLGLPFTYHRGYSNAQETTQRKAAYIQAKLANTLLNGKYIATEAEAFAALQVPADSPARKRFQWDRERGVTPAPMTFAGELAIMGLTLLQYLAVVGIFTLLLRYGKAVYLYCEKRWNLKDNTGTPILGLPTLSNRVCLIAGGSFYFAITMATLA